MYAGSKRHLKKFKRRLTRALFVFTLTPHLAISNVFNSFRLMHIISVIHILNVFIAITNLMITLLYLLKCQDRQTAERRLRAFHNFSAEPTLLSPHLMLINILLYTRLRALLGIRLPSI